MASRKQNRAAYNAELRRIRNFIRRAEKRGFRFQSIPGLDVPVTNPRKPDIERLKGLNRYSLYKYATAISEETGDIISGTQAVKERRKAAARKGQETRKSRLSKSIKAKPVHVVNAYDLIYKNIMDLINEYPTPGATYLKKLLMGEISRYGRMPVLASMAKAPGALYELASQIVYYEGTSEETNQALTAFADLIQQNIRGVDGEIELESAKSDEMEEE